MRSRVRLGQHRGGCLLQDEQLARVHLFFSHVGVHDTVVRRLNVDLGGRDLVFLEGQGTSQGADRGKLSIYCTDRGVTPGSYKKRSLHDLRRQRQLMWFHLECK